MKAYLYDIENGLYEGEAFENDELITYVDGLTTTAPPEYEKGQVPVFNQDSRKWLVVPVTEMKERLSYQH
jgi:hypothetical protein